MAGLSQLLGRRVYLDTNILIYVVEGYAPQDEFLGGLLVALERDRLTAVTSELTLVETLVRPLQQGLDGLVATYKELLQPSERLTVAPIDRAILTEAARLRGTLRLQMANAIHVATATRIGFEVFLTNDQRLRLPSGIELATL